MVFFHPRKKSLRLRCFLWQPYKEGTGNSFLSQQLSILCCYFFLLKEFGKNKGKECIFLIAAQKGNKGSLRLLVTRENGNRKKPMRFRARTMIPMRTKLKIIITPIIRISPKSICRLESLIFFYRISY